MFVIGNLQYVICYTTSMLILMPSFQTISTGGVKERARKKGETGGDEIRQQQHCAHIYGWAGPCTGPVLCCTVPISQHYTRAHSHTWSPTPPVIRNRWGIFSNNFANENYEVWAVGLNLLDVFK